MTQRKMDKHIMRYRKLNIMTHAIGQTDGRTDWHNYRQTDGQKGQEMEVFSR